MAVSLFRKLPVALAAVILITGIVIIYLRSRHKTRGELIKTFKGAKLFSVGMIAAALALTAVFAVFNHMNEKNSVYAVVSLNYSEASQAQNSNGTRYNMAEITSDEVIKRAIEKGALENVSASDLKKCFIVYPYLQGDVDSPDKYHISTEFAVEYHASKKTQHLDAENVMKLLTSAYKEYYIEKYIDSFKLDSALEKPDLADTEYMDVVSYFDKQATSLLNYMYGMAEKSPSFVTKNNTTFNSIAGKIYQFRQTQIDQNLKSLILQNGISRDKVSYIDRLSYINTNTDFDRQKNAVSFDLCNQAIAMYSEDMTRVVLVPTWDSSGKYYMGRTKVGIDELSVMATDFSSKVASGEQDIANNNLVIGKMQAAFGNDGARAGADALISEIDGKLSAFSSEAVSAAREYLSSKMNQCIAVSVTGTSILSELKTLILFMIFAYAAAVVFAAARYFSKQA